MAYANMRGDMPLLTKIYAIFRPSALFGKKSISQKYKRIDEMLRSGFFRKSNRPQWRLFASEQKWP